jgi:hypothetical protein
LTVGGFPLNTFVCSQLLVFLLCALIFGCFTYEIAVIKPNWLDILKGLLPKPSVRFRQNPMPLLMRMFALRAPAMLTAHFAVNVSAHVLNMRLNGM